MANEYRVTHVSGEVLSTGGTPNARVSQVALEVLSSGSPGAVRLSSIALEVLRSVAVAGGGAKRAAQIIG